MDQSVQAISIFINILVIQNNLIYKQIKKP